MKPLSKIYFFLFLALILSSSCEDFLDPAKDGTLNQEDVWGSTRRSFGLLNNAYNNLIGNYSRISDAMLAAGCDEALHADPANPIKGFNDGTWSKYNLVENVWDNCYEGIRKVNLFLENADNITLPKRDSNTGTDESIVRTIDRMKGEARFLRAFFHFELVRRYGGIPVIDRTLTKEEARCMERQSIDSCFHFIFNDCDSAAVRLPGSYLNTVPGFDDTKDVGRATSWAAKALKARAQLYYASPLFNPENDRSRWKDAYLTAEDVIRRGPFSPWQFNSNGNMTNLFVSNSTMGLYHKEIIFSTSYTANTTTERLNVPISYGGKGLTCPTQNLVEAFNDPLFLNRDPRLAMTVLQNGDLLNINDRSDSIKTYTGGKDAPESDPSASKTGYYLAKFVKQAAASSTPPAVWEGRTVNTTKTKILFRLPEIIYIFAEAYNEYHAAPSNDVYIYLERILTRAGVSLSGGALPDMNQAEMRRFIRKERQVELAFEEHRFFDIRRWRLMDDPAEREKYLNIRGQRISIQADGTPNTRIETVQQRVWDDKMYFYPIPESEIIASKSLTQNEGWE
ncbi:MAG: RagB/SusD family nutrient uptake outer membrane protein [Dysgonamonadaceae bacterium]|jgi:hypothetical protein|nr:RagB/SusD family nutrient uptake outer membrane protein [Dysgonamonadaceae bacterium]